MSNSNMTPRESEQTSIGSFITRKLGETTKKAKQMTTEMSKTVDAAFHIENVRRLQVRIVKATQVRNRVPQGAFERLERHKWKHLRAVLRGEGHSNVPFLPGEGYRKMSLLPGTY